MIAKFNFYDVYGYFLPGLVLLTLLWLPLGLVFGRWPSGELVTALIAIPLAYVAGHILQIFAVRVLPSTTTNGRFPSDVILDADNKVFSSEFKAKLEEKIKDTFGLEIYGHASTASSRRSDAFFQCRSALIKAKAVSYGEQFEGMYSLMRGLTLALFLGAFYMAGWYLEFITGLTPWVVPCLAAALSVAIVIEFWQPMAPAMPGRKRAIAGLLAVILALLCGGYALAVGKTVSMKVHDLLLGVALIALLLSRKCYQSYRSFTWEFAKAVYRDFATYEKPTEQKSGKP